MSWAEYRSHLKAEWEQGQHFSIIAPTGGGKTTIAVRGLLPLWRYTIVLDAKGDDPSLASFGKRVARYPTGILSRLDDTERYRIAPPHGSMRESFADALDRLFVDTGWVIYVDETRLFSDRQYFNLGDRLDKLWLFGRSRGLTLVAGTQAPRWVPSAFYDQPRWHLIGNVRDTRTLRRLGEIGGDIDAITATVPTLEPFEFLALGPDEMMVRTRLPLQAAAGGGKDST